MTVFLPYLKGTFEERLWQIGSVLCAAQRKGHQFALFNGIPPSVHRVLSASMRNLIPFAETAWPSIGLPTVEHDGKPTKTITETSKSDPFQVSAQEKDVILFVGSFKKREYLNGQEDFLLGALLKEAPFTFAPVSDEIAALLADCYFVHFAGMELADLEDAVDRKRVAIFSASPRETKSSQVKSSLFDDPDPA